MEKISDSDPAVSYPVCIKGKRACPPEDIGGIWGYASFLEAVNDRNYEEYEYYREWLGKSFVPDAFDLKHINLVLHQLK